MKSTNKCINKVNNLRTRTVLVWYRVNNDIGGSVSFVNNLFNFRHHSVISTSSSSFYDRYLTETWYETKVHVISTGSWLPPHLPVPHYTMLSVLSVLGRYYR